MTQKTTAVERLAKIETRYFKDIAWNELKPQSEEEHTTFLLSQVERLLSEPTDEPISVAQSFVDEYFADGELYRLARLPLKSHTGGPIALTWDQFRQFTVCVIACICKDLLDRGFYDSKGLFGVKGAFNISNKDLVDWLYTTPYEHIAFHVACTLKADERKAYSMWGIFRHWMRRPQSLRKSMMSLFAARKARRCRRVLTQKPSLKSLSLLIVTGSAGVS